LPVSKGLIPFLKLAQPFVEGKGCPSWEADDALYYFWPRVDVPCGSSNREADLIIFLLLEKKPVTAVIVEAKYNSGKHDLPDRDTDRPEPLTSAGTTDNSGYLVEEDPPGTGGDQLADYFAALLKGQIRQPEQQRSLAASVNRSAIPLSPVNLLRTIVPEERFLLYVTKQPILSPSEKVETLDRLARLPQIRLQQLYWVNWQAAEKVLRNLVESGSLALPPGLFRLALDTLSLLVLKGLVAFRGWQNLDPPNIPPLRPPFFWQAGSFFSGIDFAKLKLDARPSFFRDGQVGSC
jgi:hypothetical protein